MTNTYIQLGTDTVDASKTTKPDNRLFREAWQLDGEIITVDMVKARNIQRDNLRAERQPLLEALDADFMKALENGEATSAIALEKQKLRDLPDDTRIEATVSPTDLETLTLSFLMNN